MKLTYMVSACWVVWFSGNFVVSVNCCHRTWSKSFNKLLSKGRPTLGCFFCDPDIEPFLWGWYRIHAFSKPDWLSFILFSRNPRFQHFILFWAPHARATGLIASLCGAGLIASHPSSILWCHLRLHSWGFTFQKIFLFSFFLCRNHRFHSFYFL